jgi:hypothetical protein
MKRLILDYFRRWSAVLAFVGVLEFGLGWFITSLPQVGFEFWGLLLAMWGGANLLQFDLKRGAARGIAVLPLTARQIGLSWWLATIALPAIGFAALLFLGAAMVHYMQPNNIFPFERLAMAGMFNLVWLGTMFNCAFATLVFSGNRRQRISAFLVNVSSVIMLFGGMLLCQNASRDPLKYGLLLGVGVVLTAASWFRAERLLPCGAGFPVATRQSNDEQLRRLKALRPPATTSRLRQRMFDAYIGWLESMAGRNQGGQHRFPGGYGGIPFLIRTNFVRTFLTLVAMVALMALIRHWQSQKISPDLDVLLFATMGSFMSCFFIFILQPMLVLRHLRFLRTLPISATSLATVMMAFALLPLMALGAVVAGVAGFSLGIPVAFTFLKSYAFILAPASLCVFIAVWRGAKTQGYALLLLTLFGFQLAPMWLQRFYHYREIPYSQIGAFVALCVLLAFLLTRRALIQSSLAYRVQTSSTGNLPWAMGR